ncbi:MAG: aminoacyl-tRNA hydrolase [Alphaproteobacteria bacterium]|nr:aminoacyl-tRNA hydrolase [Alphaproteobacteria bacterium]
MNLLVGLGNWGREYENTRHNYGFLLIDNIISTYKFVYQGKKFNSDFYTGQINQKKVIAIKPQTYMNLSGEAVIDIINFYKISSKNLIVFHDDLDLIFGKVKFKIGGGNGGHNGLKSIDEKIGIEYGRLRLGIGRPQDTRYDISDYVLSKFTSDELGFIQALNLKISNNINILLEGDLQNFLNNIYK